MTGGLRTRQTFIVKLFYSCSPQPEFATFSKDKEPITITKKKPKT